MSKWHKGPPPSVGWWPASVSRWDLSVRWWDGKKWSKPALKYYTSEQAAKVVGKKSSSSDEVEWQHRPKSWPARSRT